MKVKKIKSNNYYTYFVALVLCLLFTIWGIFPESMVGRFSLNAVTTMLQEKVTRNFGWLYVLLMAAVVLICIWLFFSKYGKIKLGKDEDQPQFSYLSWLAMLFSAGMGIGLIFWGVAEPINHLHAPAMPSNDSIVNARESMKYTFFHWGLQPWALYALLGLILAYTTFRKGRPALISEAVTPLFAEKRKKTVAFITDFIAIVATVFGVATSLGLGAKQIVGGLHFLNHHIPNTFWVQFIVIIVVTILYMISAATGLEKGVQWLSNLNVIFAILLLLIILFLGPTSYLLDVFVQSVGDYLQALPKMSFRMSAFDVAGRDWINEWTLFYWAWWIAWSPYVASFIARISKGRTIREFVIGVVLVPTVFTFLWFTVFGGTAMWQEMFENSHLMQTMTDLGKETGLFAMLDHFGSLSKIIIGLAILLIASFFVTSADSATFVLGMFSSNGNLAPSQTIKVIWGVIQSAIAVILLYAGGLETLESVSILSSFPFLFVILLMIIQFIRALRKEKVPMGG